MSDDTDVRIEFAKRLILNGDEITPLNPNLLEKSCKSIYDLQELIIVMEKKN